MRNLWGKHELYLGVVILLLITSIGFVNPAFFTLSNLFDLCKSSAVIGIMALGVFMVLVSGGIDISFTAIAAFSMYVSVKILLGIDFHGSVVIAYFLAGCIGTLLGLVNAIFISWFGLPTLIVTLGTAGVFRGFMLAFIGTSIVNNLPDGMIRFSKMTVWSDTLSTGVTIGLSFSFFIFLILIVLIGFFMRYTMIGRGIYAMGGHYEAAQRAGFRCGMIEFVLYGMVGMLSGLAGITHACQMRNANPFDLVGMELDVIAAVVLGGTSIMGGRGTVTGTVLGVFLLVILNNSLIMINVPSYWQKVAIGLIIIFSTSITVRREKRVHRGIIA